MSTEVKEQTQAEWAQNHLAQISKEAESGLIIDEEMLEPMPQKQSKFYVDTPHKYEKHTIKSGAKRYGISWCHLITDGADEDLHVFAESLGLKRTWYQESNSGIGHYDLTANKREVAIKLGAIACSRADFIKMKKEIKPELDEIKLLALAIKLAVEAHGLDINKHCGEPFILHPMRLMMKAKSFDAKTVAILHDAIEDTDLTLEDLKEHGFPIYIIEALDALTRRKNELYEEEYIPRVLDDPLASEVKRLDLHDNIDISRLIKSELNSHDIERAQKYLRTLKRIEEAYLD